MFPIKFTIKPSNAKRYVKLSCLSVKNTLCIFSLYSINSVNSCLYLYTQIDVEKP